MTDGTDHSSAKSSARKSVNPLTKYLNLASAGLAELNKQAPMPTKAPPPEIVLREGSFAIRLDDDMSDFHGPGEIVEQLSQIPEKRLDLVLDGRSALDLSFVVPNGPFNDLEAMIDTEIAFRSPFQRDQCVWFWSAKETENLDWEVEAAIVLNSSVDWVLEALRVSGKTINYAKRYTADDELRIAVYPSWLTSPRRFAGPLTLGRSVRMIPPVMRFPLAGFAILLASFVAVFATQSIQLRAVAQEAELANTELAKRAALEAQTRALRVSRTDSETRIQMIGNLAGLLPDEVWLEQVSLEDDRLTLTGFGPSAANVTRLLSELEQLSEIQFGSPVTRDNTQNLERFRIDATLVGDN